MPKAARESSFEAFLLMRQKALTFSPKFFLFLLETSPRGRNHRISALFGDTFDFFRAALFFSRKSKNQLPETAPFWCGMCFAESTLHSLGHELKEKRLAGVP